MKMTTEDHDERAYEVRDPQGGSLMIRHRDAVRVRRPWPGERGFRARFLWVEPDGVHATVYGGRGYDPAKSWQKQHGRAEYRTVPLTAIHRMSQAHVARRVKGAEGVAKVSALLLAFLLSFTVAWALVVVVGQPEPWVEEPTTLEQVHVAYDRHLATHAAAVAAWEADPGGEDYADMLALEELRRAEYREALEAWEEGR